MIKNFFKKTKEFIKANPQLLVLPLLYLFPEYFGDFGFLFMGALAYDAVAEGRSTSGTTLTFSHTCSGSDRVLVVFGFLNAGLSGHAGAKYNGVAMTEVVSRDFGPSTYGPSGKMWIMINPPTGAHNVEISYTNSGWIMNGSSLSLTGADQVDANDAVGSGEVQSGTTVSANITPVSNAVWIVDAVGYNGSTQTWTPNGGQTERLDTNGKGMSTKPITVAGLTSTGWTGSASGQKGLLSVAIKDATQPPSEVKIEKGLIYAVVDENSVTKSLKYVVTSDVAVQKSLKYTVVTEQTPITKGLDYYIVISDSITKSLQYEVTSEVAVQKSLKYTVKSPVGITKGLIYTVVTDTNINKSLQYEVTSQTALQKSLEYEVIKWFQPAKLTLTLGSIDSGILSDVYIQDSVLLELAEESGVSPAFEYDFDFYNVVNGGERYVAHFHARYTGSPSHRIKLQQYNFNTTNWDDVTSNSSDFPYNAVIQTYSYEILSGADYFDSGNVRLRICHCQGTGDASHTFVIDQFILEYVTTMTRTLAYEIKSPVTIQKSLKYTIDTTPSAITKGLDYFIMIPTNIQKSLQYEVLSQTAINKSLKYTILTIPSAITKSLEYQIIIDTAITKGLIYEVIKENAITKSLQYALTTMPVDITKSLEYRIFIPEVIQKSLNYEVILPTAIGKQMQYTVKVDQGITKSLSYEIVTETAITKSLRYAVTVEQTAITKSLKYVVTSDVNITKSLEYALRSFPYTYGDIPAYRPFY